MKKTPKQIADLPVNEIETRDWLHDASARDIQAYHRFVIDRPEYAKENDLARVALQVRISEDQLKAAEILEHYTRTLVRLQWALIWLTVGLFVLTVVLAVRH